MTTQVVNRTWISAFAIAGISATSGGEVLSLTFNGVNPGSSASYNLNSGAVGSWQSTNAGVMTWQQGRETFCIQLYENISFNQTVTYEVLEDLAFVPDSQPGNMGPEKAMLISDLYARNYGSIGTGAEAAAFQLAIWEIVHETEVAGGALNLGLGTGIARFDASLTGVMSQAEALLNGLGGVGSSLNYLSFAGLRGLTNEDFQDQLIVVPGPAGLAGLMGRRTRSPSSASMRGLIAGSTIRAR